MEPTQGVENKKFPKLLPEAIDFAKRMIALKWTKETNVETIAGTWQAGYTFGQLDSKPQPSEVKGGVWVKVDFDKDDNKIGLPKKLLFADYCIKYYTTGWEFAVGSVQYIEHLMENGWTEVYWLDESLLPSQPAEERRNVWQLCPKCFGDGNLARYNSPSTIGTDAALLCDVCNGNKIIATYYVSVDGEKNICEFAEWVAVNWILSSDSLWYGHGKEWEDFIGLTIENVRNQYLKTKQ